MDFTTQDRLLADAIGLDHMPRGTHLRYIWRLTASDPRIIGGSARVMVAGFEVSEDPYYWLPCVASWRAAAGTWYREPRAVATDITADLVVSRIKAVRWCHLSRFGFPPYGRQLDGNRYSLLFWTAEEAGVMVNVDFLSSLRRRPVLQVLQVAVDLADQVAGTSDDPEYRDEVARCFPGAGESWHPPPPDRTELGAYVSRLRTRLREFATANEQVIWDLARHLWLFGVDDCRFADLLPDYPPELAARVLPYLRLLREDDET